MNPKSGPNVTNLFAAPTPAGRADAVRTLLFACALVIVLHFVPYAEYATYPLRLLVTFIHEGSHALAAVLTGGHVQAIAIQPDGSGTTQTWGGFNLLISSAGYLGATLYGALLVGLLRRGVSGRLLLLVTGACVGLATLGVLGGIATLHGFNVFGLFWGIVLTLALIAGGLKMPQQWAGWAAAFVGAQCILNALFDLKTLFTLSVTSGVPTDAQNMARMTLIPAPVWAVLWLVTAFFMLWAVVLRPQKKARAFVPGTTL